MEKATIQQGFNNHFKELMNDIENVLPDDVDVKTAKNTITALMKVNPKIVIGVWYRRIFMIYKKKIEEGDISFFLEKDYTTDVHLGDKTDKVMDGLNRLRGPIVNLGTHNHEKAMKYLQNLSKLSELYFVN
tara:strand:+ start:190 stop:582 length:393 start_codon:yes stop_codon:yes gene_type:complete